MKQSTLHTGFSTIEEVQNEIKLVKKRIELKELDLQIRLKQVPQESIKAGVQLIVPTFFQSKLLDSSIHIIKDILGLFSPATKNKSLLWIDIAKQVGVIGIFQNIFKRFKK